MNLLLLRLILLIRTFLTYNNVSALSDLSTQCLLRAMSHIATKNKRSQTSHERNYLNNVHFSNYSTHDCHVTRTEVVTTLAHPGVDANGNVKWFEAN